MRLWSSRTLTSYAEISRLADRLGVGYRCHGTGREKAFAQRGTVLLTAWEAAELAASIRHEEAGAT